MKLSEAILEGSKLAPHNTGGGYFWCGSACVTGMAALACGFARQDANEPQGFSYEGMIDSWLVETFPAVFGCIPTGTIYQWNDNEKCTPERIAARIARIEAELENIL